jgi:hypothetical protein
VLAQFLKTVSALPVERAVMAASFVIEKVLLYKAL